MPAPSALGLWGAVGRVEIVSLEPLIEQRDAAHYVAVRTRTERSALGVVVPGLLGEVAAWLAACDVTGTGVPIVRYLVVDYATGEVEVDVGTLVSGPVDFEHPSVHAGVLPAGRWATLRHVGGYEALVDSTALLLDWGRDNEVSWAGDVDCEVTTWGGRVERYLLGPDTEHDPALWVTEIAVLLAEPEESSSA
jgi:effector-binding domain-containing protein